VDRDDAAGAGRDRRRGRVRGHHVWRAVVLGRQPRRRRYASAPTRAGPRSRRAAR
jgi:hypothetical protein